MFTIDGNKTVSVRMTYNANRCYRGIAINIMLCVCVYVRARKHDRVRVLWRVGVCMRVRACSLAYPACSSYAPYLTSFVAPLAPPHFSTLSHKRHDFRKRKLLNIKCVFLFFSTMCV